MSMAATPREQLWTAPRAAKDREILFQGIENGSVVCWQLIDPLGEYDFSNTPGLGRDQAPKIGGLKSI
jgi:hypothetical protein